MTVKNYALVESDKANAVLPLKNGSCNTIVGAGVRYVSRIAP